ncbi:hypothetical protein FS749_012576 [Ceratobasidium sp. UAMH 11750]|nr:hypothetical protein FS749_012576 [Ceratobasidium sp. UAMH 11750]
MSRLSRIQRAIKVRVHLTQEFERFLSGEHQAKKWTLGYCPSEPHSQSNPRQSDSDSPRLRPDPSQAHLDPPQPAPLRFSQVPQLPVWLIHAGKPVLAVCQLAVLGLFGFDLLESDQPCMFVEDELESIITASEAAGRRSTNSLEPISQKLRSLVDMLPLVQWRQWPWDHIYQPIRQHTLKLLAKEERLLRVSYPDSFNQAMTVSEFQGHLLERIKDHARRVEAFRLGSAAEIQVEMEDRISQVWTLIRADIDTSNAPLPSSRCVEEHRYGGIIVKTVHSAAEQVLDIFIDTCGEPARLDFEDDVSYIRSILHVLSRLYHHWPGQEIFRVSSLVHMILAM